MHRFVAGTCQMTLRIIPQGPWMVRGPSPDGVQSNKVYVLLDHQQKPFLPASSLKGVLRSTAERILRTVDCNADVNRIPLADATFVEGDEKALKTLKRSAIADSDLIKWNEHTKQYTQEVDPSQIYHILSAASQLFGCTVHAGLLTLDDAYPKEEKRPVEQTHVAISRFTGGAGRKLLFSEDVAGARIPLNTTLTITNFTLWQIGLLALVFQEMNLGYVGIGAGTRKGHGHVMVEVAGVTCTYNAKAYQGHTGIISAQACLSEDLWNCDDIPLAESKSAKRDDGTYLHLLENRKAEQSADWRQAGMVQLTLDQKDDIALLFKEAVEKAWCRWVCIATEEGTSHA